jgi:hypothetical protein
LTLAAPVAHAQALQSPHDALLDLYFSDTAEAVEQHLLNSTQEQLQHLDPSLRRFFFDVMMVRKDMAQESGVTSKRGSEGNKILVLQGRDGAEVVNLMLEKEEINGDAAVVETVLHRSGGEDLPVKFRVRKEGGQWRLARIEIPDDDSFLGQLDSPGFVDTLKKMAYAGQMSANRASAVGCLKTIITAEITFYSTYPHGFSPDLKSLGGDGPNPSESAAGLIDESLASGKKGGYTFTYTAGAKDKDGITGTFSVVARPDSYGNTGKWNYFIDESGVIRETQEDRAATANDAPIQ